jgi:hypothetical protein
MFPPRVCAAVAAIALVAAPGLARAAPFSEHFDSGGAGWEPSGLWRVQDHPEAVTVSPAIGGILTSVPAGASLPSAFDGTGAAWFGDPATGTYCLGYASLGQHPSDGCRSDGPVQGVLTSPAFALPGPAASVRFHAWWEIAAGDFEAADLMTVEYSVDGGVTWTEAQRLNPSGPPFGSLHQPYTSGGLRAPGVWRAYSADLSSALGVPEVRIRFRFDSVNDLGQGFRGLLVDDVIVEGSELPGGAGAGEGLAPGAGQGLAPGTGQPASGLPASPAIGSSIVLEPVSGRTTYTTPGARQPVVLTGPTAVPTGTIVDTRDGTVRITASSETTGTFHDGAFQIRVRDGFVELALRGGHFPHCDGSCASAVRRRRTIRRLWGTATGRFRTRGRYASGTVRGTEWLVEDHVGDTLVRVRRGSALVRDFVRDRDVIVDAGQSYVARVVFTNRERGNPRFGRQYTLAVVRGRVVHRYATQQVVVG